MKYKVLHLSIIVLSFATGTSLHCSHTNFMQRLHLIISTFVDSHDDSSHITCRFFALPFLFCFMRKLSFHFFPSCIVDWNELDEKLKKAISKKYFQSSLVKLVRPPKRNNFKILDKIGLKYLT